MELTMKENSLTAEDFSRLYSAVGWTPPGIEQVQCALEQSLAVFSVHSGDMAVGMARLVGDGAMTFFIKDIAVLPEFQGKGIGKLLISELEKYILRQLKPGWAASAELMSSSGKEKFYEKHGFRDISEKGLGAGMMKMIRR